MILRISTASSLSAARMMMAARPALKRGSSARTTATPRSSVSVVCIIGLKVVPRTLTVTDADATGLCP